MLPFYILDRKGEPVQATPEEWSHWLVSHDRSRVVATTHIGKLKVSTVFLGIAHNWKDGDPVLWETMIFGPEFGQFRCGGTREQAEAMHAGVVAGILKGQKKR